jgi:succinoglycan biosynthesis protein ExoM
MTGPTVSVLIASMGRASLLTTLESIDKASVPPTESVEIVIADDSTDGSVATRLAGQHYRFPVHVVPVGARNVAIARSASLDAARGDWLLLVDDDEFVDPAWIVEHLRVAREFEADAVIAPVYPVYPDAAPDWFKKADPMFHDIGWSETGRRVSYGQSGNALIRASSLGRLGLRFDPEFGKTGGEDDDFFRRFAAAGAKLVVTDRAKVWESVPTDRATAGYVEERMSRTGRLYGRTMLRNATLGGRLRFAIDAAIKLGVAALASLALSPLDRARAFRMRMKVFSNVGKLSALTGVKATAAWK